MTQTPDRAYMTPLLNRIAAVAGERAALVLGREKAGQKIYIPGTMTSEHWLATMIGLEAATAIADTFGSQHIVVPAALSGEKIRRARVIAQLLDEGYSINQIVQRTGVSFNTVRNHAKKRGRKNDRQGELF